MRISKAARIGFLIDNGYLRLEGYGLNTRLRYTGKPIEYCHYHPSKPREIDSEISEEIGELRIWKMLGYWAGVI